MTKSHQPGWSFPATPIPKRRTKPKGPSRLSPAIRAILERTKRARAGVP